MIITRLSHARRALVAAILITGLITGTGVAVAAGGTTITFKVKQEYAKAVRRACGKTKNFRLFHRRSTIEGRGFVTPAPSSHATVTIALRRCVRGHWVDAGRRSATTKLGTGKFKDFFAAAPLAPRSHHRGAVVYYYARASALGRQSDKSYFAVTN